MAMRHPRVWDMLNFKWELKEYLRGVFLPDYPAGRLASATPVRRSLGALWCTGANEEVLHGWPGSAQLAFRTWEAPYT